MWSRHDCIQRFAKWLSRPCQLTHLWTFTALLAVSLAKTWQKTAVMRKRELLDWRCSSLVALTRRQLWALPSTRYHWLLHLFLPACSSSRHFLLSAPKWGQGSEVSRESNDNCDNHFAKRCILMPCSYHHCHGGRNNFLQIMVCWGPRKSK